MADAITIKALQDASLDAKSLSEFIFKPADFMVSRRLAPPVNTLQYYIDLFEYISIGGEFNSAKIESLTVSTGAAGTNASVETGGTPSNRTFALTIPRGDTGAKGVDGSFTQKAYTTEALMIADKANIPANTSVDVTNDPTSSKNGTYAYNGTTFTKSVYDPVSIAKANTAIVIDNLASEFVHTYEPTQAPYVEVGATRSDKCYFKLFGFGLHITVTAGVKGGGYTWAQVMADIGDTGVFKTSPKGMADCLEVYDQSILFNKLTGKFSLVDRKTVTASTHIEIARFAFAQLAGGKLFDVWLSHRSDLVEQVHYYANGGNTLASTPHIEEAVSNEIVEGFPDPALALYIKFNDIRIRTSTFTDVRPTWDSIVTDIKANSTPTVNSVPIANYFVTSPKGEPNCLVLINQALLYNVYTKKFYIVDKTMVPQPHNEVLVASVAYGQLDRGMLFDWWISRRIKKLETSAGGSNSSAATKTIDGAAPKWVASGGVSGPQYFAPYNSVTSFRLAGEYGYWGIEVDLVETKDGEWVLIHDLFLSFYVNATGNVKDYTLAELKAFQAGKPSIQYGWDKVQLMELRECLDLCVTYNLVPFLEFKSVPTTAGIHKVVGYIRERMDISGTVMTSFDKGVISAIRALHPDAPLLYTTFSVNPSEIEYCRTVGNCILAANKSTTQENIKLARAAGLEIAIWTITQQDVENNITKGCQYIVNNMAVPYDFKGGIQTLNFKSNADFSNMTSVGGGTVDSKQLTVTGNTVTYEVPVASGDVVTASCVARSTGAVAFKLDAYNAAGTYLRTYTTRTINKGTDDMYTVASIAYDADVSKVTVAFVAPSGVSMTLENIRVKKFEV